MSRSLVKAAFFLAAASVLAGVPAAVAADVGLGLRAGTVGLGAEIAVGVSERLTVRGGLYTADVTDSFDEGGISYDGELSLGGAGVLLDLFPTGGAFHLTAGLFSNDNRIDLTATPTQPQEIGGTVYTPAEIGRLFGDVTFDDTVFYAGLGWGNVARGKRTSFLFDLGVLAQGGGKVRLDATNPVISDADLQAEARQIEDDISSYDLWPVISLGLAIRF